MFFNSFVLTKKGPLAKIWLAAHWEKKLTKNDIHLCDISEAVVQIIQPQVPISCRTSGELLLGCVRIYANKVGALLKDSQEATLMVTRTGMKKLELNGEKAPDMVADRDKITFPGGIDDIQIAKGLDLDVEDIDVLLGKNAKEAQLKQDADARAMIDDEWFQAETSQVLTGIDSQEHINPKFGAEDFHELGMPVEAKSESEGRDGRQIGDQAELDVGKPATDAEEAELQKMLDEGVPMPAMEDEVGRPSLEDDMLMPQPQDDFPPLPEEPEEPKAKRPRKSINEDQTTILSKEIMQRNQKSQSDIVQKADGMKRFPAWHLGPQALRERARVVADQLLDAPLTMRGVGDFGLNVPMVCIGAIEVGDGDVDLTAFKECVQQQLSTAANALQDGEGGFPPMGDMSQPLPDAGDAMWPPPEMGDEFAPLPETTATPGPAKYAQVYESTGIDPVVSARRTLNDLKTKMKKKQDAITFDTLTKNAGRRAAAQRFMDLLVLGSKGHVNLKQDKAYGTITVTRAEQFDDDVADEESQVTQD